MPSDMCHGQTENQQANLESPRAETDCGEHVDGPEAWRFPQRDSTYKRYP